MNQIMGDIIVEFRHEGSCRTYALRVSSRYPEQTGKRIADTLRQFVKDGVTVSFRVEPTRLVVGVRES